MGNIKIFPLPEQTKPYRNIIAHFIGQHGWAMKLLQWSIIVSIFGGGIENNSRCGPLGPTKLMPSHLQLSSLMFVVRLEVLFIIIANHVQTNLQLRRPLTPRKT